MNLAKKIEAWVQSGIIDPQTGTRILEFESEKSPHLRILFALSGLSGLAIGIGIISVIAANWDKIPPHIKLTNCILLSTTLSVAIYFSLAKEKKWLKETLITIYYIYVLAGIALVGQIYQLGTPTYQGLLLWSVATGPLVLLGEGKFLSTLWYLGLLATYLSGVYELQDLINSKSLEDAIFLLIYICPFCFLFLGYWKIFINNWPNYANTFQRFSWGILILLGSLGSAGWYQTVDENSTLTWGATIGLGLTVLAVGVTRKMVPSIGRKALQVINIGIIASSLSWFLPLSIPHESLKLLGALSFISFWALIGWAAIQLQFKRLFNAATTLIAVRIFIIYLEVFGSLLTTGLGLIFSGVLILGFTWLWYKKSSKLRLLLEGSRGTQNE